MEFLSRLLSSLIIGLIALPAYAYVPDELELGYIGLNNTQKFLIRNGMTVPYNKQVVKRVVVGKARIMPNGAIVNLPFGPDMLPSFDALQHDPKWQHKESIDLSHLEFNQSRDFNYQSEFLFIHALDVFSTYKGLKYDCISEANPIVGKDPSLLKLILFKVTIISLLESIYGAYPREWDTFQTVSAYTTGVVVQNNFQVTKEAKRNPHCFKR